MNAYVYVDGLNLYHRALKKTPWKWLDLVALCQMLCEGCSVPQIRYFTSRVSSLPWDPTAPQRQDVYLQALESFPTIQIHYGRFQVNVKDRVVAGTGNSTTPPQWVKIVVPEEKGADVMLAVHLMLDASKGSFERAYVLSNDADLAEPIKLVISEYGKEVVLLNPELRWPSSELEQAASRVIRVRPRAISKCLLPNPLVLPESGRELYAPPSWGIKVTKPKD
jgi:hypothetical protein